MRTYNNAYKFIRKRLYLLDAICIFGLAVLSVFIHSFLISSEASQFVNDASRYNGFQAMLIKYSLENFGQFAFWDHLLSGGRSWIADPAGSHFSPFTWLVIALTSDSYTAARYLLFIHAVIAPVCFYALMRVIGVGRAAAFFVAIPFVANRYAITYGINGWLEEYYAFYLLPLSVLLYWLALKTEKWRYAVLCGATLVLHFFENTFYVFHYNIIVILWLGIIFGVHRFYSLLYFSLNKKSHARSLIDNFRSLPHKLTNKQAIAPLVQFVIINSIISLTLVGLSAIKVLPLLEFRAISSRSVLPLADIEVTGEVETFQFLFQRFFHMLAEPFNTATAYTNVFTQSANYIILALVCIAAIAFLFKRNILIGSFASLLTLGVWGYFAHRIQVDLYAFFYYVLPGFNSNKSPFRFFIIIHFAFFVLAALGLNVLLTQKKFYAIRFMSYLFALTLVLGSSYYTYHTYNKLHRQMPMIPPIVDLLKTPPAFTIERSQDLDEPPKIDGPIPDNLLYLLTHIVRAYQPEGRVYANHLYGDSAIPTPLALETRIPSWLHSYEAQIPTYQFHIVRPGTPTDTLSFTEKRYKVFSILNIRFQHQWKNTFEYPGCEKLSLPVIDTEVASGQSLTAGVCAYLENRLVPLHRQPNGGIYYDKNVLGKLAVLNKAILVIGDNRLSDFSSFIAKTLVFHETFDVANATIFTDSKKALDQYTPNELKQFAAVILVDPIIENKLLAQRLLNEYQIGGGKLLALKSTWRTYNNLHLRSDSIFSTYPAWQYGESDAIALNALFASLQGEYQKQYATFNMYTPEKITAKVTTQKDNTPLQFSDSYFPGWHATVDSKRVPVYMADGLVKGIIIREPGEHVIEMYYRPRSLMRGALITGSTIIALIVISFARFINKQSFSSSKRK